MRVGISSCSTPFSRSLQILPFLILLGSSKVHAIQLDLTSNESIKQAASSAAFGMMTYYTGNNTGDVPGNLPDPYYWWECGAMFMSLIDYWFYTRDSTYNEVVTQGMLHQGGLDVDFMPVNQTTTLGNDDQAFWALAAMDAAELNFPNPPEDQPQWLALAQGVWNTQAPRWDESYCQGGLRWQVFFANQGYNYKNTISNGCFFQLSARLSRYTGNATYAKWAEKAWDWSATIGLITDDLHFYDGSVIDDNCTSLNRVQWSYNAGVFLYGAANMWDLTKEQIWRDRVDGILAAAELFFQDNVMYEYECEPRGICNIDQRSFKAYLSRWMAATTQLAPWTYDSIMAKLSASAIAAAQQCSGGDNGETCGLSWVKGQAYDGITGVGEQMAAMAVFGANLINQVKIPVTNSTGGTSKGDYTAGTDVDLSAYIASLGRSTTGDRVGAGIITIVLVTITLGGAWFIIT